MAESGSSTLKDLQQTPQKWLVTGVAGFIGSHLLERLLNSGQKVVGVDNFSTGKKNNLELVRQSVSSALWNNFTFHEGDIRDLSNCRKYCQDVDIVLHQAALGSVTRSIADPVTTHEVNVLGFFNLLFSAKEAKIKRFVYASSSSVYGDSTESPKIESRTGRALSPYALSKKINEQYAQIFSDVYGFESVGLRYFNVFGPRQNPDGEYAAVIPRWTEALLKNQEVVVYGDGLNSRDFCYVDNVVSANIAAAITPITQLGNHSVFNIACGKATNLLSLMDHIKEVIAKQKGINNNTVPKFLPPRPGDVKNSLADISLAKSKLNYEVKVDVNAGIEKTVEWFYKEISLK
jgi:UDP-N-acetylglucosamine/UDP-N-acetylgalactosamine 4-epimerase